MTFLNLQPVQQPEAYIGSVMSLLDEQGRVNNDDTRAFLKDITNALIARL